jgi:hypothetical protein
MIIKDDNIKKRKKCNYINLYNVKGKVKKFDEQLHKKYDIEAREVIKCLLGDSVEENPDIYGEDMIFTNEKIKYKYLEIQVMAKWDGDIFPYRYPFVYARKMRFSKKTLFVTFNKSLTEIILFAHKGILKKPDRLKKYDRELINYVPWCKTMKMKTFLLSDKVIRTFSGEYIDSSSEEDEEEETDEDE